ncbi:MAG: MFS transporter, partial [Woeseiaceae bacterium]
MSAAQRTVAEFSEAQKRWLFIGCFVALTATSFGFVVRTQLIGEWGVDFNLTEVQKGEIFGVGLWPFAISIILFSLVIDRIGYGKAMVFAFACHVMSVVLTIFATGYWSLYIATFIAALGNGTVEAVINPAVATMYPKDKTKWLIILHAGWPAGLVLGGMLAIGMGSLAWEWKAALLLIPTFIYGAMLFRRSFPIDQRVAGGVSYNAMLKETGGLGALIVLYLIFSEIGRVFDVDPLVSTGIAVAAAAAFGFYVKSLGRPI